MSTPPILISACLVGRRTRYDGRSSAAARAMALARIGPAILICPEVWGGLPTPRPAAQIVGGEGGDVLRGAARVQRDNGEDVTDAFRRGAGMVAEVVLRCGVRQAYLKDKSPACGPCHVKRGGATVAGRGVCAARLEEMGVEVHAL